mmetsp:Transcript_21694/g.43864  ORF Transcript_21694/g.43864 Transcript_21694/m.43864 type:complete len:210 (+) Transcript_21694:265-894(+)
MSLPPVPMVARANSALCPPPTGVLRAPPPSERLPTPALLTAAMSPGLPRPSPLSPLISKRPTTLSKPSPRRQPSSRSPSSPRRVPTASPARRRRLRSLPQNLDTPSSLSPPLSSSRRRGASSTLDRRRRRRRSKHQLDHRTTNPVTPIKTEINATKQWKLKGRTAKHDSKINGNRIIREDEQVSCVWPGECRPGHFPVPQCSQMCITCK